MMSLIHVIVIFMIKFLSVTGWPWQYEMICKCAVDKPTIATKIVVDGGTMLVNRSNDIFEIYYGGRTLYFTSQLVMVVAKMLLNVQRKSVTSWQIMKHAITEHRLLKLRHPCHGSNCLHPSLMQWACHQLKRHV